MISLKFQKSFTLLELLIVIGILAVLTTASLLVINPVEYLNQARDSKRIIDIESINKAVQLAIADNPPLYLGDNNTVYLSLPAPLSNCMMYLTYLPSLPLGWSYRCQTAASSTKVDGNGWIPVNFSSLSIGSPFSALPIDPINLANSNQLYYYTYVASGDNGFPIIRASRYASLKYKNPNSVIRENCATFSGGNNFPCYSSLAKWESDQQRDLVALNQIAIAKIEGTWTNPETTALTIDGWTTGPNNYIKIYTDFGARHNGKWDMTKYRLVVSASSLGVISDLEGNIRIEGLQIENTANKMVGNISGINANSNLSIGEHYFSHNLIISTGGGVGSATTDPGISIDMTVMGGTTVKVYNNIIYNFGSGITYDYGGPGPTDGAIYNNTVIDSDSAGIWLVGANNNLYVKNNLVQGTATNYNLIDIQGVSNNLSEDASAPGTAYDNKVVLFVDETGDDFHLSVSDTSAKDFGADLSSDSSLSFSDDIDSQSRSGTWDIGADEY